MNSVISQIKEVSNKLTQNQIERLRIEEEMLYLYVKNSDVGLSAKTEAFKRIKEINEMQLKILGG